MSGANSSALDEIRLALARQDWQRAHEAASTTGPSCEPAVEAERLDLLADAAWWLGRLDECTRARETAYRLYDDLEENRRAGQCAVSLYEHHAFAGRTAIAGAWLRRARRAL